MTTPTKVTPTRMKADDVKRCAVCGQGPAASGLFYVVRVEMALVNHDRLRRQVGLEMMLGSPAVAAVMGERDVIDRYPYGGGEAHLCVACFNQPGALLEAMGVMAEPDEEGDAMRRYVEEGGEIE